MKRINLNENWRFKTDGKDCVVNLPHTWNNLDGQGSAEAYLRTRAVYSRTLPEVDGVCYLEVLAANSVAEVYLDGEKLCSHRGGYSAFWTELTGRLGKEGKLEIAVDNSPNDAVYPTMADFTFYGGLYFLRRSVPRGKSDYSTGKAFLADRKRRRSVGDCLQKRRLLGTENRI